MTEAGEPVVAYWPTVLSNMHAQMLVASDAAWRLAQRSTDSVPLTPGEFANLLSMLENAVDEAAAWLPALRVAHSSGQEWQHRKISPTLALRYLRVLTEAPPPSSPDMGCLFCGAPPDKDHGLGCVWHNARALLRGEK